LAQIFIAHSSRDKALVELISANLRQLGIVPYVSELEGPKPQSLPKELEDNLSKSSAMFVILARNVTRRANTKAILHWEVGKAGKKPIYVWAENGVKVPMMIELTRTYDRFDPVNARDMLERMMSIGKELKSKEEQARLLIAKAVASVMETTFTILQLETQKS